jgi:peptidoglycan/xylan/chitin deacetylase (PgdA/CDA1 family)
VLEDFGLPATVFLATGLIGTERVLWTAELGVRFRTSRQTRVDLSFLGVGVIQLRDAVDREFNARAVVAKLKRLPPDQRDPLVQRVRERLGADDIDLSAFAMMDWGEVDELDASGLVTFGGHTINHEILSPLSDEELASEVEGSMQTVFARLRSVSRVFAYPNGTAADFDSRAAHAVRQAGGTAALSTIEGLNRRETDRFALRRFNIGGGMSFDQFRILTSGARLRPGARTGT